MLSSTADKGCCREVHLFRVRGYILPYGVRLQLNYYNKRTSLCIFWRNLEKSEPFCPLKGMSGVKASPSRFFHQHHDLHQSKKRQMRMRLYAENDDLIWEETLGEVA